MQHFILSDVHWFQKRKTLKKDSTSWQLNALFGQKLFFSDLFSLYSPTGNIFICLNGLKCTVVSKEIKKTLSLSQWPDESDLCYWQLILLPWVWFSDVMVNVNMIEVTAVSFLNQRTWYHLSTSKSESNIYINTPAEIIILHLLSEIKTLWRRLWIKMR